MVPPDTIEVDGTKVTSETLKTSLDAVPVASLETSPEAVKDIEPDDGIPNASEARTARTAPPLAAVRQDRHGHAGLPHAVMVPEVRVAVPPDVTEDDGLHVMSALGIVKIVVPPLVLKTSLLAVPVALLEASAVAVNVMEPDDGEPNERPASFFDAVR